ncbi:MAG: glycosyltransferase family 2 protein [Sulfuricurvum sp.]|nr:glycosyltransferase family 2 protein [Sulfuricurvum sp.]
MNTNHGSLSPINVSFITINYNSAHHTIALIQSIIDFTSSNISYEIIVIDNASNDEDFTYLQNTLNLFSQVILVRNRINNGFAGGNMLGINHASGEYYFFVNNDCKLLNDTAFTMKKYMDNHNDVAVATGKITDEKGHFSSSYKQFPSVTKQWLGNSVHRWLSPNSFPSNKTLLNIPTAVEVISGSCMFFRASDFHGIGGFDTVFFLYCEEEDICKRVWNSGKQIYFIPDAEIFHAGGGSSAQNIALEKEFYISYNLLINKHFKLCSRLLIKIALWFKQFRRIFTKKNGLAIFLFIISGSPIHQSLRYSQIIK